MRVDELDEREAWAVLASVAGIGPVKMGALVGRAGSARATLELAGRPAGARRLAAVRVGNDPIGHELIDGIGTALGGARSLVERLRSHELDALILEDDRYPTRLRAIEVPPPVLFVRGEIGALDDAHAIAIVGTRRPTERGRVIATEIAASIARTGATVVSGLAVGIDGVAHQAVTEVGGVTVGVLGSGHDHLYPRAHERLADRILETDGAIVTEHPPQMAATSWTFPQRNRIISGLADATIVVEAGLKSGALITATWALGQGRDCFLVPGSIESPQAAGCLAFLRKHASLARIVATVPELLDDLGLVIGTKEQRRIRASTAGLGGVERQVAEAVHAGHATVDALADVIGLPVAAILGAITLLETRGLVVDVYGHYRPIGSLGTAPARRKRRSNRSDGPSGEGPSGGGHDRDEPTRSAA